MQVILSSVLVMLFCQFRLLSKVFYYEDVFLFWCFLCSRKIKWYWFHKFIRKNIKKYTGIKYCIGTTNLLRAIYFISKIRWTFAINSAEVDFPFSVMYYSVVSKWLVLIKYTHLHILTFFIKLMCSLSCKQFFYVCLKTAEKIRLSK